MSTDTLWIDQYIKEEHINYYEFNEFNDIEEIDSGRVWKANWKRSEKCIALKSFNLDKDIVKQVVNEVCN